MKQLLYFVYSKNNFVKEWIKRCPNIKSLIQNINTRDTNVILGEKERTLYCGLDFPLPT